MKNIIFQYLKKCKVAKFELDETTNHLFIPKKQTTSDIPLILDNYYIIEVSNYILNPPFQSTLVSNWNQNQIPKSKYLFGTPTKQINNMVRWDCCGYDTFNRVSLTDTYRDLWLPETEFIIMEKMYE